MYNKSRTCKGKISGTYLNEYVSEEEAQSHADYLNNNSVPYKCKTCNMWHLSPKDRNIPGRASGVDCGCKDSFGRKKELYITKSSAEQRAVMIGKEKGIALSVYKCKKGQGWHLTKRGSKR